MKISIAKALGLVIVFVFVVSMFSITYSTPDLTPAQKQVNIDKANLAWLPEGATDAVTYDGIMASTTWKTFKWHGQCFLIKSVGHSAVMTTINCQPVEMKSVRHGLYKFYWKSGGCSLTVVGSLHSGQRWFACANWVLPDGDGIPGAYDDNAWDGVERIELITTETE